MAPNQVPFIETTIETSIGEIKAVQWNPESQENILALHGWLDNSHSFKPIAEHLSNRRITAIDFPGHGKSDHKPDGTVHHFVDAIHDVLAIADGLGWESFHLLGHSMGAGIASLVASVVNERVLSLACIDGLGPLSAEDDSFRDQLRTHLRQRKRLKQKLFPIYETIDDAVAARTAVGNLSEASSRLLVERALIPVEGGFTWRTDARLRLKTAHPFSESQVQALISCITCPTLLIRAKQNTMFDSDILSQRKKYIPDLVYHEVDGHHHVHMDNPDFIAPFVERFYRSIGFHDSAAAS